MSSPNRELSVEHLLQAQTQVWNLMFNLINHMCLKCAVELGIPDIIHKHGKPMSLSDLTNALPINKSKSECVGRLMRVLVHSQFFDKVKTPEGGEEEGYWLTPPSHLLVREGPWSMAPFFLSVINPTMIEPLHHLGKWFQDDHPTPFFSTHGMGFWEYAANEPTLNKFFNDAMASDSRFVAYVITSCCGQVFEGLESLVDVAGGTGTVAKAIADAFPGLRCTVLDLPHVVPTSAGGGNVTYVGGDMFESIPSADAILLKWIFHDWNDQDCIKILNKCREALITPNKDTKKGKVIIIDMVVDEERGDQKAVETQLFFDMVMMYLCTGKERTEKEWAKLFSGAGFTSYNISPMLGLRSVIEVFP